MTGGSVSCLSGDKWEISRNFIRVLGTNAGGSDWAGVPILFLFQTNTKPTPAAVTAKSRSKIDE